MPIRIERRTDCPSYYDREPRALALLRAREAEKDLIRAGLLPALRGFKEEFWATRGVLSPITTVYPDTSLKYCVGYKLSFGFPWSEKVDGGRFRRGREVPITAYQIISAELTGESSEGTSSLDFTQPPSQKAIIVTSVLGIDVAERLRGVESAEVAQMAEDALLDEKVQLEDRVAPTIHTLVDTFRDRMGVDVELVSLLTRYGESLKAAGLLPPQLDIRGKIRAAILS